MAKQELTKDNFLEQVARYGFLAEQIPMCFNSREYSKRIRELVLFQSKSGKLNDDMKNCSSVHFSIYKNEYTRRILSLPNPEVFTYLISLLSDNWELIVEHAKSECSQSPIIYLQSYDDFEIEYLNSENLREDYKFKSRYNENIEECIRISLGYKYRLKLDVSNCYNSIYTHSITWAMCGKEEAKEMFSGRKEESQLYSLADEIDVRIRTMNDKETNGIITGPFTSRIFSEIILARIDKELLEKGFNFRRYVDDFKFYFKSECEAKNSIPVIEEILNKYKLNLNMAKTAIEMFPYESLSKMEKLYDVALKDDGAFGVLNAASELLRRGEKGAYKYALKYLYGKKLVLDKMDLVLSLLINIMLINPRNGNYIIKFLKEYINEFNKENIEEIINNELESSLKLNLQQETTLFLCIIKELNINIKAMNLLKALQTNNDFACIIALDIWKNRKDSVAKYGYETRKINEQCKKIFEELKNERYSGEHWLLLYESEFHNLEMDKKYKYPQKDMFFTRMKKLKITFYDAIKPIG